MNLTLKLPTASGTIETYRVQGTPLDVRVPARPFNRIAYSAAHVVADPLRAGELNAAPAIDWERTLEYRRYLLQQGLGIAEAMDTAQRGMGLPWRSALELITRTIEGTRDIPGAAIASGVGTDHVAPASVTNCDQVIRAYAEQLEAVQRVGGRVILMASRALARVARSQDDYRRVYREVLAMCDQPVILHWLGEMFDPELAGYWGATDYGSAAQVCLDVIGAMLMVGAALVLMLALSLGGIRYPWASWHMVGLLACSAALWVLFALRLLTAREPFIPLAILHGRVTSTMTIAAFFSIGTVIGVTIYMPLYCQTVLGVSASLSGLALIAYMGGATLGSLVSTRYIVRIRHYMRVPLGGLVVGMAMLGVLAVDPASHGFAEVVGVLFVLGLGLGPMYPVSTIVMQNSVKPHQLGTATGTLNFFRTLGGAIVVAVFGAIILGGVAEGSTMTLDKLAAGHSELGPAFHWVFIAAAICLGISFGCLLAVEERPLHGPAHHAETAVD